MTHTRSEILAMTPEQLRVEIAKKKGWTFSKTAGGNVWAQFHGSIGSLGYSEIDALSVESGKLNISTDYPNDIAAAWGLVLDLQKSNVGFELYNCWITSIDGERWTYEVILYDPIGQSIGSEKIEAPTAPLAISRAWMIWSEESGK